MTDLAAALDHLEAGPYRPGPACAVASYLAELLVRDAAMHARVVALIDNPAIVASGLADVLRTDGLVAGADTVRRHRKRSTSSGCRCPR